MEAEAETIRRIFQGIAEGRGYAKVAQGLNADAVPCPRGRCWAMTGVREMVYRELYRGRIVYGKTRWEYRRAASTRCPGRRASGSRWRPPRCASCPRSCGAGRTSGWTAHGRPTCAPQVASYRGAPRPASRPVWSISTDSAARRSGATASATSCALGWPTGRACWAGSPTSPVRSSASCWWAGWCSRRMRRRAPTRCPARLRGKRERHIAAIVLLRGWSRTVRCEVALTFLAHSARKGDR